MADDVFYMINIYKVKTLRIKAKIFEIVNDEQTVFYSPNGIWNVLFTQWNTTRG